MSDLDWEVNNRRFKDMEAGVDGLLYLLHKFEILTVDDWLDFNEEEFVYKVSDIYYSVESELDE